MKSRPACWLSSGQGLYKPDGLRVGAALNAPGRRRFGDDHGHFRPHPLDHLGAIALLLFGGRGKLSSIMGDAAKGVRAFRDGLKGEDDKPHEAVAQPLPAPAPEKDPIVR